MLALAIAASLASTQPSMEPRYLAWTKCLNEGAGALSRGHDAADLVVQAAFIACEDLERPAREAYAVQLSDQQWQAVRVRMERLCLLKVIMRRAERVSP